MFIKFYWSREWRCNVMRMKAHKRIHFGGHLSTYFSIEIRNMIVLLFFFIYILIVFNQPVVLLILFLNFILKRFIWIFAQAQVFLFNHLNFLCLLILFLFIRILFTFLIFLKKFIVLFNISNVFNFQALIRFWILIRLTILLLIIKWLFLF